MRAFLSTYTRYFTYITTAVLLFVSVLMKIQRMEMINTDHLLKILVCGAVTALPTAVLLSKDYDTRQMLVRICLHYLLICGIMIWMGNWFGWMSISVSGIIFMMLAVTFVYACTYLATYLTTRRESENLNQALRQKYPD